eukprot:GHVU01128043.1.p1 GENE.GHVU01128043.1~~GHVU01128043.1.p1  ORF type:complete len:147 (+),score=5.78 GHVU01128043.1:234-674(+)
MTSHADLSSTRLVCMHCRSLHLSLACPLPPRCCRHHSPSSCRRQVGSSFGANSDAHEREIPRTQQWLAGRCVHIYMYDGRMEEPSIIKALPHNLCNLPHMMSVRHLFDPLVSLRLEDGFGYFASRYVMTSIEKPVTDYAGTRDYGV